MSSAERARQREEALRPCRLLGYDHEALALYLYNRGADRLAIQEIRRAIWLNPFEPRFKSVLKAMCQRKTGPTH